MNFLCAYITIILYQCGYILIVSIGSRADNRSAAVILSVLKVGIQELVRIFRGVKTQLIIIIYTSRSLRFAAIKKL